MILILFKFPTAEEMFWLMLLKGGYCPILEGPLVIIRGATKPIQ